jgi:hypothetical protein
MIDQLISRVDRSFFNLSGKVFYSGRLSFEREAAVYVLGVNPGGDPDDAKESTVKQDLDNFKARVDPAWSAYADESWKSRPPGTWGMQPRVIHLFERIGLDSRSTPASNLIFLRSRREAHIGNNAAKLAEACWPFHSGVIDHLRPRMIVCFGKTVGNFVRRKLAADVLVDQFIEQNERRWPSMMYASTGGPMVAVLTHPSIANWKNPSADPSLLVARALNG